jgi:hypothetical protein
LSTVVARPVDQALSVSAPWSLVTPTLVDGEGPFVLVRVAEVVSLGLDNLFAVQVAALEVLETIVNESSAWWRYLGSREASLLGFIIDGAFGASLVAEVPAVSAGVVEGTWRKSFNGVSVPVRVSVTGTAVHETVVRGRVAWVGY